MTKICLQNSKGLIREQRTDIGLGNSKGKVWEWWVDAKRNTNNEAKPQGRIKMKESSEVRNRTATKRV